MRSVLRKKFLNDLGFTLVEVAIVLVLFGLMAALSLPDFNKAISRYNLDSAARGLTLDIRSLQQSTMKNESPDFYILFDTVNDKYYLKNGMNTYKTVNLPSSVHLVFVSGFRQPANNNKLEVAANGRPINGFGGHISLRERKTGKFLYVIVDTIGRVRVSETPP